MKIIFILLSFSVVAALCMAGVASSQDDLHFLLYSTGVFTSGVMSGVFMALDSIKDKQ